MATKMFQVYRCEVCGNIVEVLHTGAGQLVCCSKPMKLLGENTTEASEEKHVPVIEKSEELINVKVGSVAHPMEESHFIEWIELVDEKCGWVEHQFLKPGLRPEASFGDLGECSEHIYVRAYCNLHGLWKKEG